VFIDYFPIFFQMRLTPFLVSKYNEFLTTHNELRESDTSNQVKKPIQIFTRIKSFPVSNILFVVIGFKIRCTRCIHF
jgi:hypothetical protein